MSLIRVSTQKAVKPRIASVTVPSQYPITWFNEHLGEKPKLNVTLTTDSLENSRKVVLKGLQDESLDLGSALTYLYHYAETVKVELDEDWKSYDRTIGSQGDTISPLNLFDVTTTSNISNKSVSPAALPTDDPWMIGYILSVYRLMRATTPTYRALLLERIKSQMQGLVEGEFTMPDCGDKHRGWLSNKTYNKFVAAYDMFFHRFPDHSLASLRICTTGSRHRDCAGLTSYGYIAEVLGVKSTTDVMDWVFLETIATDIDRIMSDDDELERPYSYFPYQVDFGLVAKSSYSATINPCFFEWVHLIGAMMGSPRSQNARHITDKQSSDIFANAACVAYVHNFNFEFTKAYTETGDEVGFEGQDDDASPSEEELAMKSKDPLAWLTLIRHLQGNLPEKVRAFIRHTGQSIKDPRPGSMNEHLKRKAAVL